LNSSSCDGWGTCERPSVTGFCVRIVVKGRVGPSVRSVLAGLDAAVTPRHKVFVVGPGDLPELLVALESLDRRGVEVDRISRLARFVDWSVRTKPQPEGGDGAG
jgi:hypothetical protein